MVIVIPLIFFITSLVVRLIFFCGSQSCTLVRTGEHLLLCVSAESGVHVGERLRSPGCLNTPSFCFGVVLFPYTYVWVGASDMMRAGIRRQAHHPHHRTQGAAGRRPTD